MYARFIKKKENSWSWDVFIVATGKAHSVKDFAEKCFKYLGLNYRKYLKINKKFLRPSKTSVLIGDTRKIRNKINYKIKFNLDKIIKIMMDHELKKYR